MYLGLYWFDREQNVSSATRTVLQVLYVFQKLDFEIFTKYRLILSPFKGKKRTTKLEVCKALQALHSTRFLNIHQILQQKYPLFSKLSVIFEN